MFLQISMPIVMPVPVSSGGGGPWASDDTKVFIAIYLAIAVLWFLSVLYSLFVNKMTLKEALALDDDYFYVMVSNLIFYICTICAAIAVIGVGIYSLL